MPRLHDQIARETRTAIGALLRRLRHNRGYLATIERELRALPTPATPWAPAPGTPAALAYERDRARLEPRAIRFRGHIARDEAALAILTEQLDAHLKTRAQWADQVRALEKETIG
jgi:hypothetical protein